MSKLKLNVNPYFDDFDESKGFQRILFRPNFSIQARELNQLQSILQDQITKLSGQFYQNGDYVRPGELVYTNNISYITLSTDLTDAQITSLPGSIIGRTTGSRQIKCKVITATKRTGTDSATLFVTRVKSGGTDLVYSGGDIIYEVGGDGNETSTQVGTVGTYSGLSAPASGVTGKGSAVQVSGGVYYINGHFVYSADGILLLDKYTTTPTYRIGFSVAETAVNVDSDSTLYDNANGSPNYLAPGANRYKIALTLSKVSTTDTTDSVNQKFVELCRVVNGVLKEETDFISNSVDKDILSERDYEESGNYVKDDFAIEVREHLDSVEDANGIPGVYASGDGGVSTKLAVGIYPGKASIKGKDISITSKSYLSVDKSRDTVSENTTGSAAVFGHYIVTKGGINFANDQVTSGTDYNVATGVGAKYGVIRNDWMDFASAVGVNQFPFPKVALVQEDTNTASSDYHYIIGYCKIRNIQYESGGEWRIYIFDIETEPSYELGDATAMWSADSGSGFTVNGQNESLKICSLDKPTIMGTGSNTMIYEFPKSNISSVSEIEISETIQTFDGVVASSNRLDLNTAEGAPDETWVQTLPNGYSSAKDKYSVYGALIPSVSTTLADNDLTEHEDQTVELASTVGLPSRGGIIKVNEEFIYYREKSSGSSTTLAGLVRGVWGSIPASDHGSGDTVTLASRSWMVNADSENTKLTTTFVDSDSIRFEHRGTGSTGYVVGVGNLEYLGTDRTFELIDRNKVFPNGTILRIKKRVGAITSLTLVEGGANYNGGGSVGGPMVADSLSNGQGVVINVTLTSGVASLGSNYIVQGGWGHKVDDILVLRKDSTATYSAIYKVGSVENDITDGADAYVKVIGYSPNSGHAYQVIDPGYGYISGVGTNGASYSQRNHEIEIVHSPSDYKLDPSIARNYSLECGISASAFPNTEKYTVIGPVKRAVQGSEANRITKTLTTTTENFISRDSNRRGEVVLSKPDGINNKWTVYMSADYDSTSYTTDITSRYTFDGGQRDNFITNSKIVLKSGEQFPTGRIQVKYFYYAYGAGDFVVRDSYPADGYTGNADWGTFTYSDISTYTASNGKVYRLSDSVDFRPLTSDSESLAYRVFNTGSTISSIPNGTVKVGASGGTDKVSYYTSRIDKVYLDEEGNLGTIKGTSSIDPQYPPDPSNAVVLYNLDMKPYVHSTKDVSVEKVNNNKYENQEISLLEQRIENLETFNILSPLENEAASYPFGEDRFVRGFVTDPFIGHDKGDTLNGDYNIAVDGRSGQIRPAHSTKSLGFDTEASVTSDYTTTGVLVHLPITAHTSEIFNLQSNTTDQIRSSDVTTFYGYTELDPKFDRWKSVKSREFLVSNKGGVFDTIKDLSDTEKTQGTVWNDWKTHWSGVHKSEIEFDNRDEIVRRHQVSSQMVRNKEHGLTTSSYGEKYLGTNYNPYIRSRTINIDSYGLKPNTTGVKVYIDDIEVTQDVVPDSGDYGTQGATSLSTHTDGTFKASYVIPNEEEGVTSSNYTTLSKFPTGPRVVNVTADDSEAKAYYNASGIVDTKDIYATDIHEYSNDSYLKETLSQEFTVVDDMFATKVDLYFSVEPDNINENLPIMVQIRKMVDGKPSNIVIPYSTKVLNIFDVSTTAATTVTFTSPIYLSKGKYSISFLTSSTGYSLNSLDTDSQGGSKGIYVGNMYRGTKRIPNRMIKFNLYRATFNTSPTNNEIAFDNQSLPSEKLGKNPIWTTTDSTGKEYLRIMHYGHGFKVNDYLQISGITGTTVQVLDMGSAVNAGFTVGELVGTTLNGAVVDKTKPHGYISHKSGSIMKVWMKVGAFTASDTVRDGSVSQAISSVGTDETGVNGILLSDLTASGGWFKVSSVENDSYTVQKAASDGGAITATTAYATGWTEEPANTVTVANAHIKSDVFYFLGNTITPTGTSITWSYANSSPTNNASYTNCQLNENVRTTSSKYIDDSSSKVYLKAIYNSTNSRVSPVIDKNSLNTVMVQNLINKPKHQVGSGNQSVDINTIYTNGGGHTSLPYVVNNNDFSSVEFTDTDEELWRNCKVGQFLRFDGNNNKYGLIIRKGNVNTITVDTTYYQDPSDETFDFNTSPYAGQIDVLNYFVNEISPDSGSATSVYVSKAIQIPDGANEVRIIADVKMPIGSEVLPYVKLDTDNTESFELTPYKKANVYGYKSLHGYMLDSDDDKYTEVDWGYHSKTPFSKFAVKLVFNGTDSYKVPVVKNLKVIATYVL